MEAEQAKNPYTYIPKAKAKHRPPPTTDSQGKKKRAKPDFRTKDIKLDQQKLRQNVILGCQVAGISLEELLSTDIPSSTIEDTSKRPHIIRSNGLNIRVCKGCHKGITKEEQEYPCNLVFRRKSLVGFYNKVLNK